jgi:hypothetical protein
MAGKTGKKPTGRKPQSVRRQSAKTDGAFGREGVAQVEGKGRATQLDKSTAKNLTRKSGGAA